MSKLDNKQKLGLIAQEVKKVLPELVVDDDLLSVNYQGIVPVLINAFKEQHEELEKENEQLVDLVGKQQDICENKDKVTASDLKKADFILKNNN